MNNAERRSGARRRRRYLENASRIAGGDHVRRDRGDVPRLAIPEAARRFRLDEIVDAGTAAAEILLEKRHELDAGNGLQQLSRRLPYTLGVRKVTRIMV